MRRLAPLLLLALVGCSSEEAADPAVAVVPGGTARVTLEDGYAVTAEVADDDAERARGLMGRAEVPEGTGMVFLYDSPVQSRFWMHQVQVPLTAVFAREGRVVGVVDMQPCTTAPERCERYGPDEPYDTVLETAPDTVAGRVEEGDPIEVEVLP